MYKAVFDANGLPLGFYSVEVHGDEVPTAAVDITDEQWQDLIDNQGLRRWDGSKVVEYTPPIPEPEPVVTILPAVTLWERMNNDEGDQVKAAMDTQPFRVRQIFLTANTFRSDHELWPLLVQIATELFGAVRAAELLAP